MAGSCFFWTMSHIVGEILGISNVLLCMRVLYDFNETLFSFQRRHSRTVPSVYGGNGPETSKLDVLNSPFKVRKL